MICAHTMREMRPTSSSALAQPCRNPTQRLAQRSPPLLRDGVAPASRAPVSPILVVCIVGGFMLAFLQSFQMPDVYRIRVMVLSSGGTVVDDAELVSSVGGDFRRGVGISELVVPASLRPADGKVILCARRSDRPSRRSWSEATSSTPKSSAATTRSSPATA